jgi:hypothetical protein
MNTSNRQRGTVAIIVLAAAISAGCSDAVAPTPALQAPAASASDTASQSSVVGTVPAGPSKEAPATTSAAKSDISKAQQSNSMPMPGQANDHSTPAPNATQKANSTVR